MNATVLVVEDVVELSDLLNLYLSREGLSVTVTETAEDALACLPELDPDIILLDINLPGMDGFEFLHAIHGNTRARVIIVSARDADEDIITGLGYGADEFITKPFSPRVLVARVRALLRRERELLENNGATEDIICFGPYRFDLKTSLLWRGDERIQLSAREFDVLRYLVENSEVPKSTNEIYANVWKNRYGDSTAVAVYIQRLRKKLEEDPAKPQWIETVHGIGYRFVSNKESS